MATSLAFELEDELDKRVRSLSGCLTQQDGECMYGEHAQRQRTSKGKELSWVEFLVCG